MSCFDAEVNALLNMIRLLHFLGGLHNLSSSMAEDISGITNTHDAHRIEIGAGSHSLLQMQDLTPTNSLFKCI